MANDVSVKTKDGRIIFPSPSGEKERIKYIWNENRDGLVVHERIDVVKDMNEKARGMSIAEQIIRLDHGDNSVLDPNRVTPEDYSCDVSGMPEHPIQIIDQAVQAKVAISAFKAKEAEDAELEKLRQDLIAKKKAYDEALKAVDAKKSESVKEPVKEGE